MYKKIIAVIFSITFSQNVLAEWSKTYPIEYSMGDADTKIIARKIIVEQAREMASSEAGVYVEKSTSLSTEGNLKENIKTISASIIKVVLLDEKMSVNGYGQVIYIAQAKASLDEEELKRRIDELHNDSAKEILLAKLAQENKRLRDALSEAISRKTLSDNRTSEYLKLQESSLTNLDDNYLAISQVFKPGELLSIAEKNDAEFEIIKKEIDRTIQTALDNINVSAKVINVVSQDDGLYDVSIDIKWDFDLISIKNTLNKYVVTSSNLEASLVTDEYKYLYIPKNWNVINKDGYAPNKILKDKVFQYISKLNKVIKIEIGGKEFAFFIIRSGYSDYNCKSMGRGSIESVCLYTYKNTPFAGIVDSNELNTKTPIHIFLDKNQLSITGNIKVLIM